MRTLFILGAGASKLAGAPLMAEFLDHAETLYKSGRITDPIGKPAFEDVFAAISDLQGVYSKSYLDLDNIEAIFGAVEIGRLIGKFGSRTQSDIEKLRESLVTLIVKTLEQSVQFKLEANDIIPPPPYGELFDLLYKATFEHARDGHQFAIITFNYDLALDYTLDGHATFQPRYFLSGEGNGSGIPLLKLHGSINWGTCQKCHAVVPRRLRDLTPPPNPGPVLYFDVGSDIDLKTHCGLPLSRIPVIVPPTWNKTVYGGLAPVWKRAAEELGFAENIFVVGYSMPETDSFFRYLFALGSVSATRLKRFWVFDPDSNQVVKPRFDQLVGSDIKKRYRFEQGIRGTFAEAILYIKSTLLG